MPGGSIGSEIHCEFVCCGGHALREEDHDGIVQFFRRVTRLVGVSVPVYRAIGEHDGGISFVPIREVVGEV